MNYGRLISNLNELFLLQNARVMLSRIIEWYNELKKVTVECEFNLIAEEVSIIDKKLEYFISQSTWRTYEQPNIDEVYNMINDLHVRVLKTKRNVDKIVKSMKIWGHKPFFTRKETSSTALMVPNDFPKSVEVCISHFHTIRSVNFIFFLQQREDECKATKNLIDELMDENFRLFFNLKVRPRISSRSTKRSVATAATGKLIVISIEFQLTLLNFQSQILEFQRHLKQVPLHHHYKLTYLKNQENLRHLKIQTYLKDQYQSKFFSGPMKSTLMILLANS